MPHSSSSFIVTWIRAAGSCGKAWYKAVPLTVVTLTFLTDHFWKNHRQQVQPTTEANWPNSRGSIHPRFISDLRIMTGVLAPHFRTPLIIRWHRTYGPPSQIRKCATKPWTRTGVCENHSTSGWAMLPSLEFSLFWICQWCQAGIFLSNRQTGNQQREIHEEGRACCRAHTLSMHTESSLQPNPKGTSFRRKI